MMPYKIKNTLFSFSVVFSFFCSAQKIENLNGRNEVSRRETVKNQLFYIQRSINSSVIYYVLNTDNKEGVNLSEPVKMYWKNYASDGSTEPLNYVQRKYAYGLEIKMLDQDKKSFCINFVSYKKKKIYLIKSPIENKYNALIDINGKMAILDEIYIKIEGGTFWVPKIRYIDVKGRDFSKNEEVTERIIP